MIEPNQLEAVTPKIGDNLANSSSTIIDLGQKTNKSIQNITIISVISLTIIVLLAIALILRNKKKWYNKSLSIFIKTSWPIFAINIYYIKIWF